MRLTLRRFTLVFATGALLTSLYYIYWTRTTFPVIKVVQPEPTNYLVNTPNCNIPDIDPFDAQIEKLVWQTGSIQCTAKPAITYQDGEYLRIDRGVVKKYYDNKLGHCDYETIVRPNISDNVVTYTNKRIRFGHDIKVTHQFMRVHCYSTSDGVIYLNFHAFVLPNPEADERLDRFKQHVTDDGLLETFNVVMVGLDSVSRLNSLRQLPKIRRYLLDVLGGIEMVGYNKVADNTLVNIVPMFLGKFVKEMPWNERLSAKPFDEFDFIWKRYQTKGFRTLFAEDAPNIGMFNYFKEGFHNAPADYYLRPFSLAMEKHKNIWNQNDNCIGDRLETNFVLDWMSDFVNSSLGKPFFAFGFITRLTHSDINLVGAADEPHLQFIEKLHKTGGLDNTVLIYFGDHGMRFGNIRSTYIGKLEARLPFMTFVFPGWFYKKYPELTKRLRINAHRLSTPFDIHETLVDLLYFNQTVGTRSPTPQTRGISLFDVIPESRSCSGASILSHWCACREHEVVPTDHAIVQKGAKIAVDLINNKTSHYRYMCSLLNVLNVKQAWRSKPSDEVLRFEGSHSDVINRHVTFGKRVSAIIDYQLFVVTLPNHAIFEVSVRHNEKTDSLILAGEILRVSEIADESVCVGVSSLKKFCHCTYL